MMLLFNPQGNANRQVPLSPPLCRRRNWGTETSIIWTRVTWLANGRGGIEARQSCSTVHYLIHCSYGSPSSASQSQRTESIRCCPCSLSPCAYSHPSGPWQSNAAKSNQSLLSPDLLINSTGPIVMAYVGAQMLGLGPENQDESGEVASPHDVRH